MFSGLKRLIGKIDVTQDAKLIHVEGLPADVVARDIVKIWSTSKITNFMFTQMNKSSVAFNPFFAPDIAYTLKTILAQRSRNYNNRALQKVIDLMYENTWLKDTISDEHHDILDFGALNQLNLTLLPHQQTFLNIYNEMVPKMRLKGYVLAASPGSGKTINSIALGLTLNADVQIYVVPKNSVDEVWSKTLGTIFKKPQDHSFWTSTSNKPLVWGYKHYVFHYEQLARATEFLKANKNGMRKPFIVVDESHNLNDLGSLRTGLWIDLCRTINCQHTLPMSGTPLKAIGNEAIPILTVLCDDFDEDARMRFQEIFGKNSSRANDILRNRLGLMMYKVDAVKDMEPAEPRLDIKMPNGEAYTLDNVKDVMRKFIEERMAFYKANFKEFEKTYFYALSIFQRTLHGGQDVIAFKKYQGYISTIRQGYDPKTMKDMVAWCNHYEKSRIAPTLPRELKVAFLDARSVVKYVDLKVQGEALGRVLGKLRAQCHVDMVPYVGLPKLIDASLSKTVIFTSYVQVVKRCDQYLQEEGYQPLLVYGDTNKDLKSIIDRFAKDEDLNPLVATFDSLSTAVPLIMASTSVFMNSPFRDHEYKQARARTARLGQKYPCTIWNVFLDTNGVPNISTRSNDIMNWSREMVASMMGTKTDGLDVALESFKWRNDCFAEAMETYNDGSSEEAQENPVEVDGFIAQPNWMQWSSS